MKYVIAFCLPFFTALAGHISTKQPVSIGDWSIAVIVASAAGFGGLAGISTNDTMKRNK